MKKELYTPISLLVASLIILSGLLSLNLLQSVNQTKTITISGQANNEIINEIATFSAGVSTIKDTKQEATDEVNTKIQEVIDAVKEFGIPATDIKTESISVYQEENYETRQSNGWRAGNTVSIKLRNVEKADELTQVLTDTGATSVYGPSFAIDSDNIDKTDLYLAAMKDAESKASNIANGLGAKVGKVLHVTEGYSVQNPIMYEKSIGMGGGSGIPIEPGTSGINATVTVVYELVY